MNSAILDVDDILDRVTKKVISPFQDKNNSIKILPNMAKEFRVAEYCSIVGEIVGCGHTSLIIPMNRQCIVNREKVLRTENTNNNYMKKELVASLNPNHEIRFISKHFPPPFHDREFLYNIVTLETDANTTVIAEFPSEVFCSFSNPHCVRAEAHAIYILTKLDTNRTQMDYYAHFDLKGRSTNFIGRRFGVLSYIIKKELPNFMSEPLLYKLHFQHLRKLNELNKEDGKNLAIMMTPNNTKIRAEELLNELLQKNAALLEFVETVFPQFKAFWLPILKNQVIADKKEKGFAVLKKMKTAANLKNWTTKGEGEGEGEREGKQETESRMIMQPDTPLIVVNPLVELTIGKCGELAFESVPGSLLQVFMLLISPTKSKFRILSVLLSTLTTGFGSAMISYDMETSVANRREVPLFYDYIGDTNFSRGVTFMLLLILAALHNLSRTIGTAMLFAVGVRIRIRRKATEGTLRAKLRQINIKLKANQVAFLNVVKKVDESLRVRRAGGSLLAAHCSLLLKQFVNECAVGDEEGPIPFMQHTR
ncbi:hypothetical protein ScalyP_jg2190 [Parmales sp. scaly parma]|nr:hypothetical protein ScalyP_jg2190 [Parmales sp. scaly parma]